MSTGSSPEEILALSQRAQELMQRHRVLPSPENYELWYAYAAQRNETLVVALDDAVRAGKAGDLDHARVLHARFFATGSSEVQEEVGNQLAAEIGKLADALQGAGADTAEFGRTLMSAGSELGGAKPDIKAVLERVAAATRTIEARNRLLEGQLQASVGEVAALREKMETVRKESLSDVLTGLANRRCFDDRVREAVAEARRSKTPLSLLIGDVDHFKRFNDTYGHATGDQVLRLVGQCFKANVKGRDTAARFGGEEFVVVLPETTLSQAAVVADHIRTNVETKKIVKKSTGETLGSITLSLGVAQFAPGEEIADLINRADACLYAAKRAGRNRVLTQVELSAAPARANAEASDAGAGQRSTASRSFEYAVRALCRSGEVPLRSEIDLRHFHRFARWMVIAEPDVATRTIPMRLVGSGFFELFGRDLTDTDYLSLAEPSVRANAFDSAVEMVRRPCGLWQVTPAAGEGRAPIAFEYTMFPIFDDRQQKGQLLVYVNHGYNDATGFPHAPRIQTAQAWSWLDLGVGVPMVA
ncbi:MAG: diguanylate cyclase [Alphaproteobacteria bacterium]|jgi:diguanylate cyclase|nr:diguanylate cyclase [Alphaproteobacteria bacterium]